MPQTDFLEAAVTVPALMSVIALGVGLVFGYAALSKLWDFPAFVAGVRDFGFVSGRLVPLAAVLLTAAEAVIAVAHLLGLALPMAVPATIALLAVFLIVTVRLLARGEVRPCLCFGAGHEATVDAVGLARIALLLGAELSLFAYLVAGDGGPGLRASYSGELIGIAALGVAFLALCLGLPRLYVASRTIST